MTHIPPIPVKPPVTGFGILCIVLGVLIALPAGTCASIVFFIVFYEIAHGRGHTITLTDTGPMFLFTLLPTAVGVVLVWAGLKLRKPRA